MYKLLELQDNLIDSIYQIATRLDSQVSVGEGYRLFLEVLCQAFGWDIGHVYLPKQASPVVLKPSGIWYSSNEADYGFFRDLSEKTYFKPGEGLPGRVFETGRPLWIEDVSLDDNYPRNRASKDLGVKGALGLPVLISEGRDLRVNAVLELYCQRPRDIDRKMLAAMERGSKLLGVMIDRHRLLVESQSTNGLLQSMFSYHTDALVLADTDRRVLRVSKSCEALFGYNEKELIGKETRVLYAHESDFTCRTSMTFTTKAAKDHSLYEVEYRKKNGECFIGETLGSVVKDESGRIIGFLGAIRDTSEIKQTRESAERLRERLELALEASKIGVWDYDVEADRLVWDENMYALYKVDQASFKGVVQVWQDTLHPEDKERVEKEFHEALYTGGEFNTKFRIILPGLEIRDIGAIAKVIRAEDGTPVRVVGVNADITESEKYSRRLAKDKEDAESLARSKSSFLANMSHEIRTPMNGMLGMVSLLENTSLSAEQHDMIRTIRSSGEDLMTILNDILDFSKIESGMMELESVSFDLLACMNESLALARYQASEKGLELLLKVGEGISRNYIGDPIRIRQVLNNLISNAVKFTSKGRVSLAVERADDESLAFSVADTGIGIPAGSMKRIFSAFSQGDSSITRKYGGTGLGLSICENLVKLMGGRMSVESQVGEGATFRFVIPLQPDNGAPKAEANLPSVMDEASFPNGILVAEDNSVNQKIIRMMLQKIGYRCDIVSDGVEVLEAVKKKTYDIIFMDMQMPRMDGLTATREIRSLLGDNAPVVIAMTANAYPEDKELCLKSGMVDFLSKPIDMGVLAELVAKYGKGTQG